MYLWGPVVFNEFGPLNAAFVSVVILQNRQTLKILVYLTVSYYFFFCGKTLKGQKYSLKAKLIAFIFGNDNIHFKA